MFQEHSTTRGGEDYVSIVLSLHEGEGRLREPVRRGYLDVDDALEQGWSHVFQGCVLIHPAL